MARNKTSIVVATTDWLMGSSKSIYLCYAYHVIVGILKWPPLFTTNDSYKGFLVNRKSWSRSFFFRKGGTESMDTPKDSAMFSINTCEGRFSIRFDARFAMEDRFFTGACLFLRRLLPAIAEDDVLLVLLLVRFLLLYFHSSSIEVMECVNSLRLQRVMWCTGMWLWVFVWVGRWSNCIVASSWRVCRRSRKILEKIVRPRNSRELDLALDVTYCPRCIAKCAYALSLKPRNGA